ncbi:MAG: hypothetical protein KBT03_03810 [Bacteroidales bacterium]|nr:hypothetical protein [Candidatus Scybalousia scybalohippi]
MARKQSSKIFFEGKYHKEIFFEGKYHDKMYLTDSVGNPTLVWEKINRRNPVYIVLTSLYSGNYKNYYMVENGSKNKSWLYHHLDQSKFGETEVVVTDYYYEYDSDLQDFVQIFSTKNGARRYDTFKQAGNGEYGIYYANIGSNGYHLYYATKDGVSDIGNIAYIKNGNIVYTTYSGDGTLNSIILSCGQNGSYLSFRALYGASSDFLLGNLGNTYTPQDDEECYYPIRNSRYLLKGKAQAFKDGRITNENLTLCNINFTEIAYFENINADSNYVKILADYDDFIIIEFQIVSGSTRMYIDKYIDKITKEIKDLSFDVTYNNNRLISNVVWHPEKEYYLCVNLFESISSRMYLYMSEDGLNYSAIGYYSLRGAPYNQQIMYLQGKGLAVAGDGGYEIALIEEKYL